MFQEVASLYAQVSISELHLVFDFCSSFSKSKRLLASASGDEIRRSSGAFSQEREEEIAREYVVRPISVATATLPQATSEQQDTEDASDGSGFDQTMSDYVVVALRRITKCASATDLERSKTEGYGQSSRHSEIVAISNPLRIPRLSRRETSSVPGDSDGRQTANPAVFGSNRKKRSSKNGTRVGSREDVDFVRDREGPDALFSETTAARARIVVSLGPTPLQHVEARCVDALAHSTLKPLLSSSSDNDEHVNGKRERNEKTSQIEVVVYQLPEPQHLHFRASVASSPHLPCTCSSPSYDEQHPEMYESSSILNAQRESERQIQMQMRRSHVEYGTGSSGGNGCCYCSPPSPMDVAMLSVDGLPVPNLTPETLALLQLIDRFDNGNAASEVRDRRQPFRVLARGIVLDFEDSHPSGKAVDRTCSLMKIPPPGEVLFTLRTAADSPPQSPYNTHPSTHHHVVSPSTNGEEVGKGEESGAAYLYPTNPQLAEVSIVMDVQYFGSGRIRGDSSSSSGYSYHSTLGEILRESQEGVVRFAGNQYQAHAPRAPLVEHTAVGYTQRRKGQRDLPRKHNVTTPKRIVEVVSVSVEAEGEGADLITAMATKASLSMGRGRTADGHDQRNGDTHCPHVEQHVPKVLVSDGNGLWISTSFDCEMPAASITGAISSGAQGGGTAAEAIAEALLDPRSRDLRQASAALSSWLQSRVAPMNLRRDDRTSNAPLRYAKRRVTTPFVSLVGVGVQNEQRNHQRHSSAMSETRRESHALNAKWTISTKRRHADGWEAALRKRHHRRERFLSTVYAVAVMEPTAPQTITGVNIDGGVGQHNVSCGLPVADVQRNDRQRQSNTVPRSCGDSRLADVPRLPIATVKFTNADIHRWVARDKGLRSTSSNSNSDAALQADSDDGSESFVGRMLYEGHGAGGGRSVFFDERVGGIVRIEETTCEITGPSHGNTVLRISVEMSRAANEEEINNRLRECETDELARTEAYAAALSAVATTTVTEEHSLRPPPPTPESLNAIATRRAVKNASILHNETRYSVVMIVHAMPSWLAAIRGDEIKENELSNLSSGTSNRGGGEERAPRGWLSVLEGAKGRARQKRAERRAVARKAIAPFATNGESLVARWMFRVERWRSAFAGARLRTPMMTESGDGTFLGVDVEWFSEDDNTVSSEREESSEEEEKESDKDAFSLFDSVPVHPIGSSALVVRTHTDALMSHAVAAGANFTNKCTEYSNSTEPRVEKLPPGSSTISHSAFPAFEPSFARGQIQERSYSDEYRQRNYTSSDRPCRESDDLNEEYAVRREEVEERWIPSPARTDGRNGTPTPRKRREPPNPNDSAFEQFSPPTREEGWGTSRESVTAPRTPTRGLSGYHDQRGVGGVANELRPKEAPSILYSPHHGSFASSDTALQKQREMYAASSIRARTGYLPSSNSLPQEGYAVANHSYTDMYSAAAGADGLLFSVNREPLARPIREHEHHLSPLSHGHYLVNKPSLSPPPLPINSSSSFHPQHQHPRYRGSPINTTTTNPLDGLQMGERNVQLARGGIGPLSSVMHRQAALGAEKAAARQEELQQHHQHRMVYNGLVAEPALPPFISNPTSSSLSILNRTLQSMEERMAESNTEGSRSVDYLRMRANHNSNKSGRGSDSKMLRSGTTRTDVLDEYGLGASAPAAANSLYRVHAQGHRGGTLVRSHYPPSTITVNTSLQPHHHDHRPNYSSSFLGAVATATPYAYVPPPRTAEEGSLRAELDAARSQHLVRTMLSAEEDPHPTKGSTARQTKEDHASRTTERYASAYYDYESQRLGGGGVPVPSKFGPAASSLLHAPPAQTPRTLPFPLPESMSLAPSDVLFMMCLLFPNEMLECAPLYYTALFAEGYGKLNRSRYKKESGRKEAEALEEERRRASAVGVGFGGEKSGIGRLSGRIDSLDAATRESVETYVRSKSRRRGDALKLFQRLFLLLPSAANEEEEDGSVRRRGRKRELFCVEDNLHECRVGGGGGRGPKGYSYVGPEEGRKELLRVLSLPHYAAETSFLVADLRRRSPSYMYSSREVVTKSKSSSTLWSLFTPVGGKAVRTTPRRNLITHLFACPEVEALMSSLLGASTYEATINSSFSSSQLRTELELSRRYAWCDEDVAARAWLLLGVFLVCFFPSVLICGAAGAVALKFGVLSLSATWRWLRGGERSRRWTGSIVETTTSASSSGRRDAAPRRRSYRRRINVLGGLASLFFLSSPLSQSEVDLLTPTLRDFSHTATGKAKRSSSRSSRRALPFAIHSNFTSKLSSRLLGLLYGLDSAKRRMKLGLFELVDNNFSSKVPEEVFIAIRGLKILFCVFTDTRRKNDDGNAVTFMLNDQQDDAGVKKEQKTHVKYELFFPNEGAEFEKEDVYYLGPADDDAGDELDVVLDGSVSTSIAINSSHPQGNSPLEYDTLPLERMLLGSLANSHPHFYHQYSSALSRNLAYLERTRYYGPPTTTGEVGVAAVTDPYNPYFEPYYANTGRLLNNNSNYMQPPHHFPSQPSYHYSHRAPVDSTFASPLAPLGHGSFAPSTYLTPMPDPIDHYPRRRYVHRHHDGEVDICRRGEREGGEASTTNYNGSATAASATAAEHLAARTALRTANLSLDTSPFWGYSSREGSLLPYYLRKQLSAPTLAPLSAATAALNGGANVNGPRREARLPYVGPSAPTAMNSALFDLSRSCSSYRLYRSLGLLAVRPSAGGRGEEGNKKFLPSPHYTTGLEVLSKILFVAIVKGGQQSDRLGISIRRGQGPFCRKAVSEGQSSISVLRRVRNFAAKGRCAPLWILLLAFASAFVLSVYVMLWRLQVGVAVYAFLVSLVVLAPRSPVALLIKAFLRLLLTAEELA